MKKGNKIYQWYWLNGSSAWCEAPHLREAKAIIMRMADFPAGRVPLVGSLMVSDKKSPSGFRMAERYWR